MNYVLCCPAFLFTFDSSNRLWLIEQQEGRGRVHLEDLVVVYFAPITQISVVGEIVVLRNRMNGKPEVLNDLIQ